MPDERQANIAQTIDAWDGVPTSIRHTWKIRNRGKKEGREVRRDNKSRNTGKVTEGRDTVGCKMKSYILKGS